MPRFIHFEENGDDTTTLTVGTDGIAEHTWLVPFSLDFFERELSPVAQAEIVEKAGEAIHIPNDVSKV